MKPFRTVLLTFRSARQAIAALLVCLLFAACEKGDDGPENPNRGRLPVRETVSRIWVNGSETLTGYVRTSEYDGRDRLTRSETRDLLDGRLIKDSVVAYVDHTAHSTQTGSGYVTARRTTFADDDFMRPLRDEAVKRDEYTGSISSGWLRECTYDGAGRLTGSKDYYRYFTDYVLSSETTDYLYDGHTVRYVIDPNSNPTRVETIYADETLTLPLSRTERYLDKDGMLISTTYTHWEYDMLGRKTGMYQKTDGVLTVSHTDFVYGPQQLTYCETVYWNGAEYMVTRYEIVYK